MICPKCQQQNHKECEDTVRHRAYASCTCQHREAIVVNLPSAEIIAAITTPEGVESQE